MGYFLFSVGLMAVIILEQRDSSFWFIFLASLVFCYGLEMIIVGKINEAKKEIMEEVEDKLNSSSDDDWGDSEYSYDSDNDDDDSLSAKTQEIKKEEDSNEKPKDISQEMKKWA